MTLLKHIELIEELIEDPKVGLPEDVFKLISRITPLINVDLLIKDSKKEKTLLTWRGHGETTAPGWHIPGGIIRYKEEIISRIHAVAENELGCKVSFDPKPLAINQIMLDQVNRGHFISLLYSCDLITQPDPEIEYKIGNPDVGEWSWHEDAPDLLICPHEAYRKFF